MATNNQTHGARPTNDAFTGMLAISLIALLIGTGAIYLDYSRYSGQPPKLMPTFTEPPQRDPVEPKNPKRQPDEAPADAKDQDKDKDGKLNF